MKKNSSRPAKPVIIISKCLGFAHCRYDGNIKNFPLVNRLKGEVVFRPVCPEMGMGLGVPRPKIKIIGSGKGERLVQPSTGKDLTARINKFSARFLKSIKRADGAILKAGSPSCDPGKGFFAKMLRKKFSSIPIWRV